jgi:tetratricopeptide (TPR) repeat protein
MAQQLSIPLVFCGEYRTEGGQIVYDGAFFTVPEGEEFRVGEATVAPNRQRDAAVRFRDFFNDTAERVAAISFCGQQYQSSSWEGAVQYCSEAIEISPNSVEARKALGLALKELERYPESLAQLEIVLETQQVNSDILENAGWVATQLGETEKARRFYDRFLELNPDNTPVRIQIARDLAEAGDEMGAVRLLRGGFEHVSDSTELVELHEQFGAIAFRAAFGERNRRGGQPGPDGRMPRPDPEVIGLFEDAISSWRHVVDHRGADAPPEYVRNSVAAYVQIEDYERAIEEGNRGLRTFPRDALIMRNMAEAQQRRGNLPEAIRRQREAIEIDPTIPNARAQLAQMYLSNRQADEAIATIRIAAEAGESTPDNLASMLHGYGWEEGGKKNDFVLGLRMVVAAKDVPEVSAPLRSQLDFFHGYYLYSLAESVLRETANGQTCRQNTPRLQEALRVLPGGRAYAQTAGQNVQSVIDASTQFSEMCAAIIQAGR